jgi:predicted 3-demethylubiquinone-9 3-methyltransferase (glyoxalase superfamily)
MQKIAPHLWFDTEAVDAAEFYVNTFPDSKLISKRTLHDTSSRDTDVVSFNVWGYDFMAISAGPYFKINPSISFVVACKTREEIDSLWGKLSDGGMALMELDKYPFSERYGWIKDKYGVTWQLILVGDAEVTERIHPSLLFVNEQYGKTEEAIKFYTSVFHNSSIGDIPRYGKEAQFDKEGAIEHAMFTLEGQRFAAMDSGYEHKFGFNEAVSLLVRCENQEEIDYYWKKLSAVPEAEQCGWLKDKFGVSWQVTPKVMDEMMREGGPEQIKRVTEAFLAMKKFDIAVLEKAYKG